MIELSAGDLDVVRQILAAHVPGREVRAFGSRVRGAAKSYADLDLAIYGEAPLPPDTLRHLQEAFEESNLNIRVDVVEARTLSPGFRGAVDGQSESVQAAS
jgi:type I restriction enzyme S subunit